MVQSRVDIKSWLAGTPSVAAVRPRRCPCCDAPGEELGGRIRIHGHGLRQRQLRGPLGPLEAPVEVLVAARRYRCTECGVVLVVAPRGVARRRLFTAAAILLALQLWSIDGRPAREVRGAVSPHRVVGRVAGWGWTSLGRWARAVSRGAIVRKLRPVASGALRTLAGHVVHAVAALAPPALRDAPLRDQVFAGAALAA